MGARPAEAGLRWLNAVLTTGCNLRCSYCFQDRTAARRMEWKVLRAAIDLLLRSPRDEVRLVFYGGEPLLEFPLIRRAVAYAEEAQPGGLSVRYGIITNGTLITEKVADFLARHRISTRLSFDGVPEAQSLRGERTFAVLDSLLYRLRREHLDFFRRDLCIQVTALPATLNHLADSIRYLIDTGVREINLAPCKNEDPAWRPERIAELDQEMRSVFRLCLEHFRRTGEVPLRQLRRGRGEKSAGSAGNTVCGIERAESLAVDVDGQVHGCPALVESLQSFPSDSMTNKIRSLRLGRIRSRDLIRRLADYAGAVRAAGIFHNMRERYSSHGRCKDCRYASTCRVCPISIGHAAADGDLARVPDFMCAFHLVTSQIREGFPRLPDSEDRLSHRSVQPQLTRDLHAFAEASRRARGRHR